MRVSGSCDMRHCHGVTSIAWCVVVRIRTRTCPAGGGGDAEARTGLAVLEGAGQYLRARERVRTLNDGHAGCGVQFRVDVVCADGRRMPGSPSSPLGGLPGSRLGPPGAAAG